MASVTFNDVSKIYPDGTRAVNAIDLEIQDGEFMVLVGPSGCGKTTALRMVAGLEEISEGVLGSATASSTTCPRATATSRWSSRATRSIRTSRVYDNIAFGLKLKKMPKNEIDRRVQTAAQRPGARRASSTGSRARSPAGSASVSRWAGRSCASRPHS